MHRWCQLSPGAAPNPLRESEPHGDLASSQHLFPDSFEYLRIFWSLEVIQISTIQIDRQIAGQLTWPARSLVEVRAKHQLLTEYHIIPYKYIYASKWFGSRMASYPKSEPTKCNHGYRVRSLIEVLT